MSANIVEITDANWKSEVLESPLPVVVDFYASWCPPCRMLSPLIDKLASDYNGRVKVGKLNTDQNQETPGGLGISSIPTVLIYSGGKEVERLRGVNPEAKYTEALAKVGVS